MPYDAGPSLIPVHATASANAPVISFDGVSAMGALNGGIRIVLEAVQDRPTEGGGVASERVVVGHLRMTAGAAAVLRAALDTVILMAAPAASVVSN